MTGNPEIIVTNETIAAGASLPVDTGGAEISIREIQGASGVEIKLDNGTWLPVSAGEKFKYPHERFKIRNSNIVPVVVTIFQSSEPDVYVDQRDTATSVSIGGSFSVVNSPYTDEGGNIGDIGASTFALQSTGGGADIVTAAANTNGIRVRDAFMVIFSGAANALNYVAGGNQMFLMVNTSNMFARLLRETHIPAGKALAYANNATTETYIRVSYDIL